jgi:DNA-binding transcriptional MerR regulator
MTKWYTQDVCKLTGLSARMLRHYDKIGLLEAMRLPNGYRVYSSSDLEKLQKILALKGFGFELAQIKQFLSDRRDTLELLHMQKKFLHEKIKQYKEALDILTVIIADSHVSGSVDILSTIKLIKESRKMDSLEKALLEKIFTRDQIKKFEKIDPHYTDEQMAQYSKKWDSLIADVKAHLQDDPYGPLGQIYAKQWIDLAHEYWQDEELLDTIWDHYKNDSFPKEFIDSGKIQHIPQDVIGWIDKAVGFMHTGEKKQS